MIIEKNNLEMFGNTILAPDESFRERERHEELEKSQKKANSAKKLREITRKKSVLRNIFIGFIIGMVIVFRYCMIYNLQAANSKAVAQIDMLSKENDAYDVELMKFRNIKYIEETATTKLNMVEPKISDVEYLDLNKNNLETNEVSQVKISKNVISKIKNIIF
ncbi:MAG: hypothetical protein ACREVX_03520 [Clostridium sp.]|uniref:hypothetical protein n=1 Tax=Clostridium sp. TaxID=1506 RepID=UPI003D6D54A3